MSPEVLEAQEKMKQWLSHPNEFGKSPSHIECTRVLQDENGSNIFIFKFKKSLFSKWLIGIVSESGTFSEMQEYEKNAEIADAKLMNGKLKDYWKKRAEEIIKNTQQ